MKKKRWKRIVLWSVGSVLVLTVALAFHIYLAVRPKIDEHTRVMARIDLKQPISSSESAAITNWLYSQKGVDHVLCNTQSEMVVFTYSPLQANGNQIADNFKTALNYKNSQRFIPDEASLQGSCPVASRSFSYKVYKFMKNIL